MDGTRIPSVRSRGERKGRRDEEDEEKLLNVQRRGRRRRGGGGQGGRGPEPKGAAAVSHDAEPTPPHNNKIDKIVNKLY